MKNHFAEKDIILFDLDGTLTDSEEGITSSVNYALESFGIHTENLSSLSKFIGPPLIESFKKFYGFDTEKTLQAIKKYREYYDKKGIYGAYLYEGIEDLLKKLKNKGKQLIVTTSKPKVYADIVLKNCNIFHYFDYVFGVGMDGDQKTKGEVIADAVETAGIEELSRAVVVGDRKFDVIGAKEMGIECIGILYGFGDYEELKTAGATVIVETVKDLDELL